jgi:hypothetical protein
MPPTSRFILRYRGQGPKPPEVLDRLRALPGARVIDDDSPRMILVEAPEAALRALVGDAPDWSISASQSYVVPEKRPSVQQPPEQWCG